MLQKMQSGYPRFFRNRFVSKAAEYLEQNCLTGNNSVCIPIANAMAFDEISAVVQGDFSLISKGYFHAVSVPEGSVQETDIKKFLQNTGMIPSSRMAEDFLVSQGVFDETFLEAYSAAPAPELFIQQTLASAYEINEPERVLLGTTGMSAVYAVCSAVKKLQAHSPKKIFVQLGWLYLDTMDILSKYGNAKIFFGKDSLEEMLNFISTHHAEIAAVVTEVPSNPLMQVPDIEKISELTRQYSIPFIVDSSMGTAYTFRLTEYADIVIESLTKFACGNADVMMGAAVFAKTEIASGLMLSVKAEIIKPYQRDVRRLAFEMESYKNRVLESSKNTVALVDYLHTKKQVKHIFNAVKKTQLHKDPKNIVPPVMSIQFDKKLEYYYDRLSFAKGPSFGPTFTLGMAYVYLAHYGLIKSQGGRKILKAAGLHPELLRISVGTEPIDEIIAVFEKVFEN